MSVCLYVKQLACPNRANLQQQSMPAFFCAVLTVASSVDLGSMGCVMGSPGDRSPRMSISVDCATYVALAILSCLLRDPNEEAPKHCLQTFG